MRALLTWPSTATRTTTITPYIFKTADFGATWTKLVNGIPDNTFVRAVREDPKKPGLLFAGAENGVYVSFNNGADWKPLKLNLPTVPIHDLVIKDDDLVLATHGRAFWILDDIARYASSPTPSPRRTSTCSLQQPPPANPRRWRGGKSRL